MTDKAEGGSATATRPSWAAARPTWAGGAPLSSSGTSTFTRPTAQAGAPTPSPSAEPRPPKGPHLAKSGAKSVRLGTALLGALVVALVAAAGLMAWKAFSFSDGGSVEAPLPAQEFETPAGAAPVGPIGEERVEVGPGETMTAADMGPSTLFIPALGVYMPVESDTSFVSSKYEGFDTIRIPADASHGVWYAGGVPMYGGEQGVTMIAAHVSTATGWGALRYLYTLTGGEMFYTKDADGQLQSWQMTRMRVEDHTDFPQEYWSPEGERRLVVTTCGGTVNANNYFRQNIFAVAVPVDPKPKPAEQQAAEGAEATDDTA